MSGSIYNPFPRHYSTFLGSIPFFLCSAVRFLSGTERLERSHVYVSGLGQSSLEPPLPFCFCVVYVEL